MYFKSPNVKLGLVLAFLAIASPTDASWRDVFDTIKSSATAVASLAVNNPVSQKLINITAPAATVIGKEVNVIVNPIKKHIFHKIDSNCDFLKSVVGLAYDQYEEKPEEELNKLTLEYRDPGKRVVYKITTAAEELPLERSFNSTQKLYIFIHGFTSVPSVYDTISNALSQGNSYVVALDGSALARGLFLRSSTYTRFVGERLGAVLAALVHSGVNPENIHIIGHTLGAHIAGFTGKTFKSLTGSKVARITGLDPSGLCFGHVDPELRLHKEDADFVDVVHTNAGVFGLKDPVGHVEFYPNGGEQQPKCVLSMCSHNRALMYFAEALTRPDAFPALKCRDWDAFKKQKCDESVSYLGPLCQPGATGRYFFQTKGESPFSLGEAGIEYQNDDGIIMGTARAIGIVGR